MTDQGNEDGAPPSLEQDWRGGQTCWLVDEGPKSKINDPNQVLGAIENKIYKASTSDA